MIRIPPLVRKAASDAGFDLELGSDGGWERLGIGGVPGAIWVQPRGEGALLALPSSADLTELDELQATGVFLPPGAAGAVMCGSPANLFGALRRMRLLLAQSPPLPENALERRLAAMRTTETEAIVRQRVGQDLFRDALLEYWDGRCAVTGLDIPELLRASHAKPWKDATDAERLDVHNGLLLAVNLDALFDGGLLAFADDGQALLSADLQQGALVVLGLESGVPPLRRVADGHRPYLAYHRASVWRGG